MSNGSEYSVGDCLSVIWETFLDFPKPQFLRKKSVGGKCTAHLGAMIPLFALALGVILWLAGKMLLMLLHPVSGALLFALLAAGVLELKDTLRGSCLLALVCRERLLQGGDWRETLRYCSEPARIGSIPSGAVAVGMLAAFKFLLIAVAVYFGETAWIIVVLTGSFTVQGVLAAPLLAIPSGGVKSLCCVSALIGLGFFFAHPVGVAAAAAIVFWVIRQMRSGFPAGCTVHEITFAGAFVELCLLLIGIALV